MLIWNSTSISYLVGAYCFDWQLQLSMEKCAVLHLGSYKPKFNYTLKNIQLSTTDQLINLGVVIDQKLDYTPHIQLFPNIRSSTPGIRVRGLVANHLHKHKQTQGSTKIIL